MRIACNSNAMETAWFRSAACRLLAFLLLYGFAPRFLVADADNGFDLSDSLVPVEEIHHGGPARDGIPAIDRPRFVNASVVDYLLGDDRVLGINRNGISKAYPINILNHHEIVNDDLGREAIVISYCPLCGTGMAFLASVEGSTLEFGVSGLLYNSDVRIVVVTTDATGDNGPDARPASGTNRHVAYYLAGLETAASRHPGDVEAHWFSP
jgi:hypothetical protein